MGFRGKFQDLSLVDVLQVVQMSQKSGVLEVYEGTRYARVLFREGNIVDAWPNNAVSLHEDLVKRGALQEDGAGELAELVSKGLVAEDAVRSILRNRVETAIAETLGWSTGEFQFDMVEVPPAELLPGMRFDTQEIVLDAVRVFDEKRGKGPTAAPPAPLRPAKKHPSRVFVVGPGSVVERLRIAVRQLRGDCMELTTLALALEELQNEVSRPALVIYYVPSPPPAPDSLRADVGKLSRSARRVEVITVADDPAVATAALAAGAWAHVTLLRDGGPALAYLQSLAAARLEAFLDTTRAKAAGEVR